MEPVTDSIAPPVYASFTKRLTAYGYDSLIVTIIALVLGWQLGGIGHAPTAPDMDLEMLLGMPSLALGDLFSWSDMALPLVVSTLYNIFFLTGGWQATPGKRFCGIYVVDADGGKPTLVQSTLRHATSGLSMLAMGLPCLTICFTREKIAPHDLLCDTRVVMGKTSMQGESI